MDLIVRYRLAGVVCALLLIFFVDAGAQSMSKIENILSPSQFDSYKKGDALIEKGRAVMAVEDSLARKDSKQYRREKMLKAEQGNVLIRDGFKIKMKALEEHIKSVQGHGANESVSAKYDDLLSQLGLGKKKARNTFGRSNKTPNLSKAVKYQEDAIKEQESTVTTVEKGLLEIEMLKNAAQPEPVAEKKGPEVADEKAVESKPETTEVKQVAEIEAESAAAAAVAVEETTKQQVVEEVSKGAQPEPEIKPAADVYFTIQIMADKVRVDESRLKMVYSGQRKIIQNVGSGWYRYSVGKFTSYSDAAAAMKREGIKGYVVAYKGKERITTAEAKKLLGGTK